MAIFILILSISFGVLLGLFIMFMFKLAQESKNKREIEGVRRDITNFKTSPDRKKSS